jgi:hypothetical protein
MIDSVHGREKEASASLSYALGLRFSKFQKVQQRVSRRTRETK